MPNKKLIVFYFINYNDTMEESEYLDANHHTSLYFTSDKQFTEQYEKELQLLIYLSKAQIIEKTQDDPFGPEVEMLHKIIIEQMEKWGFKYEPNPFSYDYQK